MREIPTSLEAARKDEVSTRPGVNLTLALLIVVWVKSYPQLYKLR
jgi:hypothetical protein